MHVDIFRENVRDDEIIAMEDAVFAYYANLGRLKDFVQDNPQELLSLAQAAHIARLSRTHLCRVFRQRLGLTFRQWLIRTRIRKAAQLFAERDRSLIEVSEEAGFGNVRTFQRAFRDWTGMTAREYRATIRRRLGRLSDLR